MRAQHLWCVPIVATSASLAWRRDADNRGSAGADGAASDGMQGLVEADFDGGEEVVAATDGDAFRGERGIGAGEKRDDFVGRH